MSDTLSDLLAKARAKKAEREVKANNTKEFKELLGDLAELGDDFTLTDEEKEALAVLTGKPVANGDGSHAPTTDDTKSKEEGVKKSYLDLRSGEVVELSKSEADAEGASVVEVIGDAASGKVRTPENGFKSLQAVLARPKVYFPNAKFGPKSGGGLRAKLFGANNS